jgi:hypothetical protein
MLGLLLFKSLSTVLFQHMAKLKLHIVTVWMILLCWSGAHAVSSRPTCYISQYAGTYNCQQCDTDQYSTTTGTECITCSGSGAGWGLVGGEYYFIDQRNCQYCRVCSSEQYLNSPCTATQNAQCSACRAVCAFGSYASTACTSTTNRQCTTCRAPCAPGTYETQACTPTTNRVCTTCGSYTCPIGTYRGEGCACTPCTTGTFANTPNSAQCTNCSTCAVQQYYKGSENSCFQGGSPSDISLDQCETCNCGSEKLEYYISWQGCQGSSGEEATTFDASESQRFETHLMMVMLIILYFLDY